MNVVELDPADAQARLESSINQLRINSPHLSAAATLTRRQVRGLRAGIVVFLALFGLFPTAVAIVVIAATTSVYSAVIVNRVMLFTRSLRASSVEHVTDEEALNFPDDQLPVFTVLVPAYREPEVIRLLLAAIGNLDYPPAKLDVKVLLEGDDDQTIAAARQVDLGPHVEIVLVPPAHPRTKPKALNFGLSLARGDIVSVYDAEDRPDRLQLRRAAVAFSRTPPDVVCLQARLGYHNMSQNMITRWFTIEYAMWFSLLLPGLVVSGGPVPLGGTSNHFRRGPLEALGAWDPYNVTEDADLGIRLSRQGYSVRLLDSTTLEEANSDFVNWMKQRSRWYKGYLQTWLINMRHPVELYRDLGTGRFTQFSLFVGGTPALAILNPLFWVLTIVWFVGHPHFIQAIFPAPVFYLGLVCWAVGNFTIAYLTMITTRVVGRPRLMAAAALVPVYWVMMSVGAIKALVQLVFAPSYWEKTTHGLDTGGVEPAPSLLPTQPEPIVGKIGGFTLLEPLTASPERATDLGATIEADAKNPVVVPGRFRLRLRSAVAPRPPEPTTTSTELAREPKAADQRTARQPKPLSGGSAAPMPIPPALESDTLLPGPPEQGRTSLLDLSLASLGGPDIQSIAVAPTPDIPDPAELIPPPPLPKTRPDSIAQKASAVIGLPDATPDLGERSDVDASPSASPATDHESKAAPWNASEAPPAAT